ncbi:MAG: DNA polymerase III subunit gamma/tau [Verrucomicrobia bacterium CG_4_10_14_3_um_filter_43_23]|nr:MAG: hypothetical protein AUJ82_03965 [Verrucomicrobia bacterium CG1_02_43_26]PIP58505.1 MAG: DNA polymerase III subunit gamma/tau [Verrucomicrobia bacterium CG22_combo_CG10-13_8_21_14_all_43_17]PIX58177.1 MAG: DNA polymerase III subunit gamma/tau [Verrucomicrobia bacterium CG_4_10_14_3_um_filter_43_23]PIY60830.1 MAG: DNA polymerase III subunit gamma/tau [Verrucomicrobia bacterium CG_4_10_14_0_8_um_filter_43_34]PJA43385.1 MAG: DNA polymerase III subunit gamma/tau [Verrucomicrobia bacterium C
MNKAFDPAEAIEQSLITGRLAHAVLLYGHNKSPLEETALTIAKKLLDAPNGDVKQHPDFFSLRPANKMRQISAENTRKLIFDIQHSPNQAERKVAVIYEADRMHISSANAFLKTLEEPPANTTLILLSTRPYNILDTIRSRCLHFNFLSKPDDINEPEWEGWKESYNTWMQGAANKAKSATERSVLIIQLYALIAQFSMLLEKISDRRWEALEEDSKHLSDEESIAEKTGFQKDIRQQIFRNIAETTRNFALQANDDAYITKLITINRCLENVTQLLDVNLNECVALEDFLLQSLRVWSAK